MIIKKGESSRQNSQRNNPYCLTLAHNFRKFSSFYAPNFIRFNPFYALILEKQYLCI